MSLLNDEKNIRTRQLIYRTIIKMTPDAQKIQIAILAFFAGVILTFIIYPKPEVEEIYRFTTTTETDTVYKEIKDTVYIPKNKIKTEEQQQEKTLKKQLLDWITR